MDSLFWKLVWTTLFSEKQILNTKFLSSATTTVSTAHSNNREWTVTVRNDLNTFLGYCDRDSCYVLVASGHIHQFVKLVTLIVQTYEMDRNRLRGSQDGEHSVIVPGSRVNLDPRRILTGVRDIDSEWRDSDNATKMQVGFSQVWTYNKIFSIEV